MDLSIGALLVANYYWSTLSLWVGHWFSHLAKSPLAGFHVGGHHAIYPDSRHMRTEAFRYGRGRSSSLFSLLPGLVLQTLLQGLIFSPWAWLLCAVETALVAAALSRLHIEFHLIDSKLERFRWFRRARRRHETHHDRDLNYMVGDHFWDRRFRPFTGSAWPTR